MLRRIPQPLLATLAVTAVAVSGVAAASPALATTDDDSAVLRPTDGAEVGQAVEQDHTMTITIEGSGQQVEVVVGLTMEIEITAVADDGGYETEQTILTIEQRGGDPEGEAVIASMEALTDVPMTVTVDAEGRPGEIELPEDVSPAARAMVSQFGASLSGTPLSLPDEAVTVGDEWSGEITTGNAGMSVTLDVDYTLVALDDESYTVDFEYETDVDEAGVTGTTSASGTITTNRGNPLLVDGDTVSTTELDSGGMTLVQGLDLVMTSESIED